MTDLQFMPDTLDRKGLLGALRALRNGDFSVRLPADLVGVDGEIARAFNEVVELNEKVSDELLRIRDEAGREGQISRRVRLPAVAGAWAQCAESVNALIADLVRPIAEVARVIESVARGDLSWRMALEIEGRPLRGEFLRIGKVANTMVDELGAFASEVSRVAREVGTDGKLGGQARVPGAAGTWKDLTDNVNLMAANLTGQVRNIAEVTTAVAKGDLTKKVAVDVKGEMLELKSTVNTMVDQLNALASEVSRVVREVGTDGKLGGQARVPGAAGLWRDLTGNVNQLAANVTAQVRAIAEVATAVAKGDLTRSIMVEAMGEVAVLKDNINEMIRNLKDTTLKNDEQDWLKTNLAKFTRMLQGHGDLTAVSKLVLSELAPLVNAQQGAFYTRSIDDERRLELLASYASKPSKHLPKTLRIGEGLVGQCARDKKRILLEEVPDNYVRIGSALGSANPLSIILMPVLFEGEVKAVIEIASLKKFGATHLSFLDQLAESIGVVFNTIEANMRTEVALAKSQLLTRELQSQQEELKKSNDRLEQQAQNLQNSERLLKNQQEELQRANEALHEKARQLSEHMRQVEYKNREVEQARAALEEKAEQLALSSRYKSEFLANMSHELRTPLNSLLILAKLLADNVGSNLTPKQIDYAQTIYSAGTDLLSLINDILDLAKIESGTITLDIQPERFSDLRDFVERNFRQVAQGKGLDFVVDVGPELPPAIRTDEKRLQQILKNLLSNAFKFTEHGGVKLRISSAGSGWTAGHPGLDAAAGVVAFAVADSGIGIPEDKQKVIFEAFQQADGTTSRRYGGTGLGLSISRELARRLGGEIRVESDMGRGSTFTLYLPLAREPADSDAAPGAGPVSAEALARPRASLSARPQAHGRDDRDDVQPGDRLVLIVEDDARFAATLLEVAHENGFKGVVALDARSALLLTKELKPDAVTLDLKLPDMDGWAVLDLLKHDPGTRHIPVSIVSSEEQLPLVTYEGGTADTGDGPGKAAELVVVKTARTIEELLHEARLFLRRTAANLPEDKRRRGVDDFPELAGKKVLIVDDDIRNIFALAGALERHGMTVFEAESGKDGIETLKSHPDIDVVLMDIMMPEFDGYDAIRLIRGLEEFEDLPIIAVTARAMKEDREKCIEAGASDYVSKPVDIERLLSLMRGGLAR